MNHLDFLNRVLLDFSLTCEDYNDEDPADRIRRQAEQIEQDAELSDEERQDAALSLKVARLIGQENADLVDEIYEDIFRIQNPGCRRISFDLLDGGLGWEVWGELELLDDAGRYWDVSYDEASKAVSLSAFVKADDDEAGLAILTSRIEAFLDELHA